MVVISLKKLRFINFFISALIFFVSLLLVRNIAAIFLSDQKTQAGPALEITQKNSSALIKDISSYSVILERNPFGSPQELRRLSVAQDAENRHVTPSNLRLVGTVVGPKNLSYAIIEDKTRPAPFRQDVVGYGDDVFDYGKLIMIARDYIEISQGIDAFRISLVPLTNERKLPSVADNGAGQASIAERISDKEYLLSRRKVEQTFENPEQILTDARLLPNIQDGKQEGFKMLEVKPGGLYEGLGLKNGDILLRVNDLEISNPEVAIQAMTALKGMNRVNLDIMRDGSKLSMTYEIK